MSEANPTSIKRVDISTGPTTRLLPSEPDETPTCRLSYVSVCQRFSIADCHVGWTTIQLVVFHDTLLSELLLLGGFMAEVDHADGRDTKHGKRSTDCIADGKKS